jgi:hypothetical protein
MTPGGPQSYSPQVDPQVFNTPMYHQDPFETGEFGNTYSPASVTANPLFGVSVIAPAVASPSFMATPTVSAKDDQLFELPQVVRLERILKEAQDFRFFDRIQVAIVTEVLALCVKYKTMIGMVSHHPSVDVTFFTFLLEYKGTMVRKLRVLSAMPVTSVAQRALLSPLITFMADYTETKGFGVLFPIRMDQRKGTKFAGSDFRSSFKENSGGSSTSQYKPEYQNRKREDYNSGGHSSSSSSSSSGSQRPSFQRSRENEGYQRFQRFDKDRKPEPYRRRY